MDLFGNSIDKTKNWLPKDGTVNYYGKLFSRPQADNYLQKLLDTIEWRNDEAREMVNDGANGGDIVASRLGTPLNTKPECIHGVKMLQKWK